MIEDHNCTTLCPWEEMPYSITVKLRPWTSSFTAFWFNVSSQEIMQMLLHSCSFWSCQHMQETRVKMQNAVCTHGTQGRATGGEVRRDIFLQLEGPGLSLSDDKHSSCCSVLEQNSESLPASGVHFSSWPSSLICLRTRVSKKRISIQGSIEYRVIITHTDLCPASCYHRDKQKI